LAVDETVTAKAEKGVPGGAVLKTASVTAKVTAIDPATRKLTLEREDGVTTTYTAGPEVINFDQIKIGDLVKVTAAEALVVFLRKKGEPATAGEGLTVARAAKGEKPGGLVAQTDEFTAKVNAIDVQGRKGTLEMPSGELRTVSVRDDVDLSKISVGDEVVIRSTKALAVRVEKP
jgi:Cu/Ag efflux protein CusF